MGKSSTSKILMKIRKRLIKCFYENVYLKALLEQDKLNKKKKNAKLIRKEIKVLFQKELDIEDGAVNTLIKEAIASMSKLIASEEGGEEGGKEEGNDAVSKENNDRSDEEDSDRSDEEDSDRSDEEDSDKSNDEVNDKDDEEGNDEDPFSTFLTKFIKDIQKAIIEVAHQAEIHSKPIEFKDKDNEECKQFLTVVLKDLTKALGSASFKIAFKTGLQRVKKAILPGCQTNANEE